MSDEEWALIEPYLPPRCRLGRPRTSDLREVVNALLYLLSSGCQWRNLPKDFPPRSTVQGYFYAWQDIGIWQRIVNELVVHARRALGRKDAPTAGIIDSQSVATTEGGGPRGFDAGKKVKGRKRHIVTDTEGLLIALEVGPANVQDVHAAAPLLKGLKARLPSVELVYADRVYRGDQLQGKVQGIRIEIVERPPGTKGFQLLPRRWVVERTFAWLGRCRRLAKDFERTISSAIAWVLLAHIRLLSRRLARA